MASRHDSHSDDTPSRQHDKLSTGELPPPQRAVGCALACSCTWFLERHR